MYLAIPALEDQPQSKYYNLQVHKIILDPAYALLSLLSIFVLWLGHVSRAGGHAYWSWKDILGCGF
jgi:hypothetical protein